MVHTTKDTLRTIKLAERDDSSVLEATYMKVSGPTIRLTGTEFTHAQMVQSTKATGL